MSASNGNGKPNSLPGLWAIVTLAGGHRMLGRFKTDAADAAGIGSDALAILRGEIQTGTDKDGPVMQPIGMLELDRAFEYAVAPSQQGLVVMCVPYNAVPVKESETLPVHIDRTHIASIVFVHDMPEAAKARISDAIKKAYHWTASTLAQASGIVTATR